MKVLMAGALYSYTKSGTIEASGTTLAAMLDDIERRYPGIRFRIIDEQHNIRRHIRFFVNGEQVNNLLQPLCDSDEVAIIQALSGG